MKLAPLYQRKVESGRSIRTLNHWQTTYFGIVEAIVDSRCQPRGDLGDDCGTFDFHRGGGTGRGAGTYRQGSRVPVPLEPLLHHSIKRETITCAPT